MKKIFLVLSLALSAFELKAQNYDYSVSTLNQEFVFLNDTMKTIIDSSSWDDNLYSLPIGFNFLFAGSSFDSIKVNTNGTITFDKNNKFNFVGLYKNFIGEMSPDGYCQSPISKQLIVLTNDSKQLIVEFKNAAFFAADGTKRNISFHIVLNENNSIMFHMGPINLNSNPETCIVGLLNMNDKKDFSLGFLLKQDPASPIGELIPENGSLKQLTNIPSEGTVYLFTSN